MALAFDSEAHGTGTGSASCSITTAGSNQIIWAFPQANSALGTPTVDGNNMTLVDSFNNGTQRGASYYYIGTSAGAHTVAFSATGTCFIQCVSYNGASQTGVPDAHNTFNQATPTSTGVTVVASNCWIVAWASNFAVGTNVNSGGIQRSQTAGCLADSNGAVGTGSQTIVFGTASDPRTEYVLMASFAPATSASATNNWLLMDV